MSSPSKVSVVSTRLCMACIEPKASVARSGDGKKQTSNFAREERACVLLRDQPPDCEMHALTFTGTVRRCSVCSHSCLSLLVCLLRGNQGFDWEGVSARWEVSICETDSSLIHGKLLSRTFTPSRVQSDKDFTICVQFMMEAIFWLYQLTVIITFILYHSHHSFRKYQPTLLWRTTKAVIKVPLYLPGESRSTSMLSPGDSPISRLFSSVKFPVFSVISQTKKNRARNFHERWRISG